MRVGKEEGTTTATATTGAFEKPTSGSRLLLTDVAIDEQARLPKVSRCPHTYTR